MQAGDLCLVASDGLFDNLWPNDLTGLVNTFWKDGIPTDGEKPLPQLLQDMVNAIVGVTLKYSCGSTTTPFENDALQNGYKYQGGKPDDITAVLTLFQCAVSCNKEPLTTCPIDMFTSRRHHHRRDHRRSCRRPLPLPPPPWPPPWPPQREQRRRQQQGQQHQHLAITTSPAFPTRSSEDVEDILAVQGRAEDGGPVGLDLAASSAHELVKVLLLSVIKTSHHSR